MNNDIVPLVRLLNLIVWVQMNNEHSTAQVRHLVPHNRRSLLPNLPRIARRRWNAWISVDAITNQLFPRNIIDVGTPRYANTNTGQHGTRSSVTCVPYSHAQAKFKPICAASNDWVFVYKLDNTAFDVRTKRILFGDNGHRGSWNKNGGC